jgi:RNA polymerase sigma-70 factor (ECF subfamily)
MRPQLHRYCARMVGSVLDGEDVAQDALFQAYRKLELFDDTKPLGPWLFRIAHNQCVDFLRRRRVRRAAEAEVVGAGSVRPIDAETQDVGRALERLVISLPPKERACVLLKDVFDYSLEEIAGLVGSTVGGVKSALKRGRSKLATFPAAVSRRRAGEDPEAVRLRDLYVERFNRRDWDGVRELIAADARVVVADRFAGPVHEAPYFGQYDRLTDPWWIVSGDVDGEPVLLVLGPRADIWMPESIVRLDISGGHIAGIIDYSHCPWVLSAAHDVRTAPTSPLDVPRSARQP